MDPADLGEDEKARKERAGVTMNPYILETKGLVMQFGGLIAVNNVSLNCCENEIVGLIGANGAGKTTLFNMISGQLKPKTGAVVFKGREIQGTPPHKACHLGIGRTHQIVQPFADLSVLENVMVGALMKHGSVSIAQKRAEEILDLVGLAYRRDVKGGDLNLPELKRMELARALATEPSLLLLDEVMAGLNPTDCQGVVDLIKKIRDQGMSIILIEHVMKAVMSLSDRVYVLNQGVLISQGTVEEVTNDPAVITSYLGEKKSAET